MHFHSKDIKKAKLIFTIVLENSDFPEFSDFPPLLSIKNKKSKIAEIEILVFKSSLLI